jgi:hypothetical protein
MAGDRDALDDWRVAASGILHVVGTEIVDDRIVLWVYTEEALESVTHAVLRLAIPPERVAIRILRTWLDPYPDDPELSERLWKEQCRKWHIQDGTPDTGHEED